MPTLIAAPAGGPRASTGSGLDDTTAPVRALVVYESLWGNTAAVASAIADGLGEGAEAVTTEAATADRIAESELVVAGAPVLGFSLPTDRMRDSVATSEAGAPTPPDLDHPSLRSWLEALAPARTFSAAFETRIWWSPRGATGDIERRFARAGFRRLAPSEKFVVEDKYGPLRDGELDRARAWGSHLADALEAVRER